MAVNKYLSVSYELYAVEGGEAPVLVEKTGREHCFEFVDGMCNDLIDEMQNLVFDDKNDRAIPLDNGTMQIDTWDSNIYSESGYWAYTEG